MRNHANENITESEIRTVRARRHEAKHSTPSTSDRGDEKGVLKCVSLRYFVIIFHLLHKAIVGC